MTDCNGIPEDWRTDDYQLLVTLRVKAGSRSESEILLTQIWLAVKQAGLDVCPAARARLDGDREPILVEFL